MYINMYNSVLEPDKCRYCMTCKSILFRVCSMIGVAMSNQSLQSERSSGLCFIQYPTMIHRPNHMLLVNSGECGTVPFINPMASIPT